MCCNEVNNSTVSSDSLTSNIIGDDSLSELEQGVEEMLSSLMGAEQLSIA
jgi:hypothetical protein